MSLRVFLISIVCALAVLAFAVATPLASDRPAQVCAAADGAIAPVNMLDDLPEGQLRPFHTAQLVDTTGRVTAAEIAALPFLAEPGAGSFPIATANGALWMRFALANPHSHDVDWVLGFKETILDDVILYRETASGLAIVARNGRTVPATLKASRGAKPAIPITMGAAEENTR